MRNLFYETPQMCKRRKYTIQIKRLPKSNQKKERETENLKQEGQQRILPSTIIKYLLVKNIWRKKKRTEMKGRKETNKKGERSLDSHSKFEKYSFLFLNSPMTFKIKSRSLKQVRMHKSYTWLSYYAVSTLSATDNLTLKFAVRQETIHLLNLGSSY